MRITAERVYPHHVGTLSFLYLCVNAKIPTQTNEKRDAYH